MTLLSRLKILEEKAIGEIDRHLPMHMFEFAEKNINDDKIIVALKKEGISLTKKELGRWKKSFYNNKLLLVSPNWDIDRLIIEQNDEN